MALVSRADEAILFTPRRDVTRKTRLSLYITHKICTPCAAKFKRTHQHCVSQVREREVQEQGGVQEFVAHVARAVRFAPVRRPEPGAGNYRVGQGSKIQGRLHGQVGVEHDFALSNFPSSLCVMKIVILHNAFFPYIYIRHTITIPGL
jgi:hypothetical protein